MTGVFRSRRRSLQVVTVSLHLLLWPSSFAMAAAIFLTAAGPADGLFLPSQILMIGSAFVSLSYIIIHSILAKHHSTWYSSQTRAPLLNKVNYLSIRYVVTLCILWLMTAGWNIIVIARQPSCHPVDGMSGDQRLGTPCIVEKTAISMSFVALFASCILFISLSTVSGPFEANLLGYTTRQGTSNRNAGFIDRKASYTEKRSFSSSSSTIVDLEKGRLSMDIPPIPVGLGIYRAATPSITSYRSSSYRTMSMASEQTTWPYDIRPPPVIDSAWRAVHPPLRAYPPSMAASIRPVTASTRRSLQHRPSRLTLPNSSRSCSSRSSSRSSTFVRSPLSTMRRVTEPEVPVLPSPRRLRNMSLPEGWVALDRSVTNATSRTISSLASASSQESIPMPPPLVIKKKRPQQPHKAKSSQTLQRQVLVRARSSETVTTKAEDGKEDETYWTMVDGRIVGPLRRSTSLDF